MQELALVVDAVREGYRSYQYKKVADALFDFCNDALSAIYLAAAKDRLYCDAPGSPRRRRTQTVISDITDALLRMLAPILVHTSEEAWLQLHGADKVSAFSIHLESLPDPIDWPVNDDWEAVLQLRAATLKKLELVKENGLTNPLDAGVDAALSSETFAQIEPFRAELADLCGVSRFTIRLADREDLQILDLRDEPRCERSWKRDGTVRERSDGGWLSERDAAVLGVD
jgi:isoleucyl-tRNA synthetase